MPESIFASAHMRAVRPFPAIANSFATPCGNYTRQEMQQGMEVCKRCHSAIHDLIPDAKKIGRNDNTREELLAHPQLQGFVQWKREKARNKRSKRRKKGPAKELAE